MYQGAALDVGVTPWLEAAYAQTSAPKYFVKLRARLALRVDQSACGKAGKRAGMPGTDRAAVDRGLRHRVF